MKIAAVGRSFPDNYYGQEVLLEHFRELWADQFHNPARLEQIHRNVLVSGRHLALPIDQYSELDSFAKSNDAFIHCAVDLGEKAIFDALKNTGLTPTDVDAIFFVSVTGIAAPSIDARLVNRMGLRSDIKRVPIFGLGCVAGAAGIARAADYLAGHPDDVVVLLSVELCSLTLQRDDFSMQNIIGSGLFGDGAAAVVMVGKNHPAAGPTVVATRSELFPNTENVMGWEIGDRGFRIVLSGDVPEIARNQLSTCVQGFLADADLDLDSISAFICHPGGPKVLEALESALEQPREAFALTWNSLRTVGNLSSASVLMVLGDTLKRGQLAKGDFALMLSMGPGFCAELVLLEC